MSYIKTVPLGPRLDDDTKGYCHFAPNADQERQIGSLVHECKRPKVGPEHKATLEA